MLVLDDQPETEGKVIGMETVALRDVEGHLTPHGVALKPFKRYQREMFKRTLHFWHHKATCKVGGP